MKTILDGHTMTLGDDGTLDTVVLIDGKDAVRFSQEYASSFRNDDGTFEQEQFDLLANEALDVWFETTYAEDILK